MARLSCSRAGASLRGYDMALPLAVFLLAALLSFRARAEPIDVKIGVLTDLRGVYSDGSGLGSVEAAKMAAEDFTEAHAGFAVEIISGDHQNQPDIGLTLARGWYEREGVHAIADVPGSNIALAVSALTRAANKVLLVTSSGAMALTGEQCSPNTVLWTFDSWALAHGTAATLVHRGLDTWFFVTADYVFGHSTERFASEVVEAAGGKVLGAIRHPPNHADFASELLSADASGAKVIAFASAGGDMINAIKQAAAFDLPAKGKTLAALPIFLVGVHALGLETAQGLILTSPFYWDQDEASRAFAKRFAARRRGRYPSETHAGVYSAVMLYLESVRKLDSPSDGAAIVAEMRAKGQYEDLLFGRTWLRTDGRATHPMHLAEVKRPSQSKAPWDYYNILTTIPPEQAARPLAESKAAGCELVP